MYVKRDRERERERVRQGSSGESDEKAREYITIHVSIQHTTTGERVSSPVP